MEGKKVIRGIVIIFKEVEAKVEVKVINIIITIAIINIKMIIIELRVLLKKKIRIKKNRILHLIQNLSNQILNHQVLLLTQINLPYYIPIN